MMRKKSFLFLIVVLFISVISIAGLLYINVEDKNMNLIPREVLFGNPDKAGVKLSKDGKYISYLAPLDGVLNIFIMETGNSVESSIPITHDTNRGIRSYFWTYDNENIVYMQDEGGNEDWHAHVVNIKTKKVTNVTPFKGVRSMIEKVSDVFPKEIVISLNKNNPKYFDLYKLNLDTRKLNLIYENKDQYSDLIVDDQYKLRFGSKITPSAGKDIFKFDQNLQPTLFLQVNPEDLYGTGILGFDKSGDEIFMSDSRGRDTAALISWNLITGKQSILYHSDKADLSGIITHPTKKHIQAASHNYDKTEWKILDSNMESDMKILKKASPGELIIGSRSIDDNLWIVSYMSSDTPVKYYLYNKAKKSVKFLFTNNTALESYNLAPMHSVVIKSRDGLDMLGYLTLPIKSVKNKGDVRPQKPLALVLDVHGGPTARDNWGLNMEHQWLANRGYAVLNVNYRGSTGFGKKFIELGDGEWAAKMHDDLIDSVNWAIGNKIAKEDKVAIYGGSYGGYAALVGVTFTPDVFACAVDIVGPSSLVTLMESIPSYWKPSYDALVKRLGGDPSKEEGRKFLESRSPIKFYDRITKPLLIGHGANDPRVKQTESDQIVKSLQDKNIPVTYVVYSDEGHGFAKPENKISFYGITEQFLASKNCLNGSFEPLSADTLSKSSAKIISNGGVAK